MAGIRRISSVTLTKIENILVFAIVWACILSIHYAYRNSGIKVFEENSPSLKFKSKLKAEAENIKQEKPILNEADLVQPDFEAEVQKEMDLSKKLHDKEMYKERLREKEGEFYSFIKMEEVYKWFDSRPKRKDEKFDTKKRHPLLPKYLIKGENICSEGKVDLLFYIHSKTENEKNRNAIRQTYGNRQNFKRLTFKVVFVLGRGNNENEKNKILKESETNHDIVQSDFKDVPTNLGLKVLTFLHWVLDYCSDLPPRFIVKVDDDFFINPFMLIEDLLPEIWEKVDYVSCHAKENSPIVRSKNSKWYVPEAAYPKNDPDVFPKTCSGYTALFPGDMVPLLHSLTLDVPYIPVDDAYLFSALFGKIKDVEYYQMLELMTLNKEAGFSDYKGNKRLRYMSVSCWGEIIENMNTLWNGTMRHLTTLGKQLINPKRLKTK